MRTHTTRPLQSITRQFDKIHPPKRRALLLRLPRGEAFFVAAVLVCAAILRLALAYRGWPSVNSDEATIGLMVDDILWHGAHPGFTYGEYHVGALDAYLQAPFFSIFGPTNFTLHLTTTVQMLLFLLIFYLFTRAIYSPLVAGMTIALLGLGPGEELFYTLRAGAHAQDTLLLGALLLGLVYLRLCRRGNARVRLALDLAIGLVAGLGIWSTFLMVPFVLVAAIALGVEARRSIKAAPGPERRRNRRLQMLVIVGGLIIGMAPVIHNLIVIPGTQLAEIIGASGETSVFSTHNGIVGFFSEIGWQIAATLLFGLPSMFGNRTICTGCPLWPSPNVVPMPAQALREALISAPFSLLFIGCWLAAAWPLVRDVWQNARRVGQPWRLKLRLEAPAGATKFACADSPPQMGTPHTLGGEPPQGDLAAQPQGAVYKGAWRINLRLEASPPRPCRWPGKRLAAPKHNTALTGSRFDARWWGRMMLVAGGGLTLLEYMATASSYQDVDTATRYIIGVYFSTPLIVAPLSQGIEPCWRWLRTRKQHIAATARPRLLALLAVAPLLALFAIGILGAMQAWQQSANPRLYGVPAGTRDQQVIAFLEAHHATRFYTTWWVCYRLMFDAQENVDCYIVSNTNAFAPGYFNRVPAYAQAVQHASHPAYVFDLTTAEVSRSVPQQISRLIASGDPRFAGYTSANVGGYIVFYYAGP